ncbi:hypothetical protein QCE63_14795 [Caballeronia sp. LZ065]|uniref:hypothetical protein n=1 Tax=Caballeronia sp. LZ065 TaxID=3038571 RepID=UPI0028546CEE|nr:hypothetical protein [Caballeronia sp. LZ065]MDR5780688.1 hypothetical protein [Caballeronia sp. LZ065]
MQNSSRPEHVNAEEMDEPTGAPTQQRDLDAREKRGHEDSENTLPSSQEKNRVPPDSTR